jgi:hypothetical protein
MELSGEPGAGTDALKFSSLSELDFVAFDTSKDDYLVMGSIEAPFYEQTKRHVKRTQIRLPSRLPQKFSPTHKTPL